MNDSPDDERRPPIWAAALIGAALGLAWGVAARVWMRLISTNPEFHLADTLGILAIATVFGACAGFTFSTRRRGWRGWGHYVPRAAVIVTFLPFGGAGGTPLMLTVLLATLAVTQSALFNAWFLAVFSILLGMIGLVPWLIAAIMPALALALTGWKSVVRRTSDGRLVRRVDPWLERVVRAVPLLLAVVGFGTVSWEIVTDKPGLLAAVYVFFYLILLYPLVLGLRIGLERFAHPGCRETIQPNHSLQPTGPPGSDS